MPKTGKMVDGNFFLKKGIAMIFFKYIEKTIAMIKSTNS